MLCSHKLRIATLSMKLRHVGSIARFARCPIATLEISPSVCRKYFMPV